MIDLQAIEVQAGELRVGPIDLHIDQGDYAIICGATGSGKTTLIETLAGLRQPERGRVLLGGIDVTWSAPADRMIGLVPQDSVLFESMTVAQNLAFGLKARRADRREIQQVVEFLAERLQIESLLHRRPFGLSGGERKRVAIGRAIATSPDVMLLDEPFSSLDPETRHAMRRLVLDLQLETNCTVLQVSHHEEDINALADVVVRMEEGKVAAVSKRTDSAELASIAFPSIPSPCNHRR